MIWNSTARLRVGGLAVMTAAALAACGDDDPTTPSGPTTFQVTIENIVAENTLIASGAFDTPVGGSAAGPITNGMAYEATFSAGIGDNLHFATMFVQSNDLFYGPDGEGIELYDGSNAPISGDVTSQVMLWDAGTEVDEEPGVGANQAPRQSGPDTGDADPDNTVRLAVDASGNIPAVDAAIEVTVTSLGDNQFTLRIENVGSDMSTSAGPVPIVLAPGVYAVGGGSDPLFIEGDADLGLGLEAIAEDGDPSTQAGNNDATTGVTTPIAPGVWAIHSSAAALFASGAPDSGAGLEGLAEDGDPAPLNTSITGATGVTSNGVFNTPDGASGPGPVGPGASYSFSVMAEPGDLLSFATMFIQSNDAFYAPSDAGIPLFSGQNPTSGDVSSQVMLWDAGTEVNEAPGVGSNQAPRQAGADTGAAEGGNVRLIDDGFTYPSPVLRVTITPAN